MWIKREQSNSTIEIPPYVSFGSKEKTYDYKNRLSEFRQWQWGYVTYDKNTVKLVRCTIQIWNFYAKK